MMGKTAIKEGSAMTEDKVYKEVNSVYSVLIGMSAQAEGVEPFLTYKIKNMETGVIEGETTILPRALAYAEGFYDDLRRANIVGGASGNVIEGTATSIEH